jgi:hypothetical protein
VLTQAPVEDFWYWINERHSIWVLRNSGAPKPWTDDPILRDYKFTNAYRQLDRGTVWLRENFLEPHRICECCDGKGTYLDAPNNVLDGSPYQVPCGQCHGAGAEIAALAFNICWYRMFNWWGTGAALGWRTAWDVEEVCRILNERLARGEQVFTGAHIVYSPPGRGKIEAIVDVCADLYHVCYAGGALETLVNDGLATMEGVFNQLTEVHCVGGFMAYEMVCDMRFTKVLENAPDKMTWANTGPGALRGLKRLFGPSVTPKQSLELMRQLLADAPNRLSEVHAQSPWPFELREIEHSLCEFDKYVRTRSGEGQPRGKFNGRI